MENKKNKIKVAFLGGGTDSVVGSAHYAAINLDNNFELVAGYFSIDKNFNYETAIKYRVAKDRVVTPRSYVIIRDRIEVGKFKKQA